MTNQHWTAIRSKILAHVAEQYPDMLAAMDSISDADDRAGRDTHKAAIKAIEVVTGSQSGVGRDYMGERNHKWSGGDKAKAGKLLTIANALHLGPGDGYGACHILGETPELVAQCKAMIAERNANR